MADPTSDPRESHVERRDVLLWLGVLAGPLAWILSEQLSYALTPTACASKSELLLHLASLAPLLLAAAGGALAWSRWKGLAEGSTEKGDPEGSRERFMAISGMAACAFFALVIVATWVPNLVLGACER
ncbi:MAG TPA: hypothetical protein VKK31_20415 [Thermoanaerobaculia bacterium]|nr:hypothetical protein [Thermoanaerobaculia bacterium]